MTTIRPRRAAAPVLGSVVTLAAWEIVARNSGSGWVQALGTILVGVLAVGLVAPAFAVRRARIECDAAPHDATAGSRARIAVTTSQPVKVTPLDPEGPEALVGRGRGEVVLVPARRGVFTSILVEVSTAAPFGLLWWGRKVKLELPVEMHVGPRVGTTFALPALPDRSDGEESSYIRAELGEPYGIRPYRAGDSRRLVHWPATAHSAHLTQLMIRETDRPKNVVTVMELRLPANRDAAEELAERALGTVLETVSAGGEVILETTESEGKRSAPVADRRSAARRLARAVGGPGRGGLTVSSRGEDRSPGGEARSPGGEARSPGGEGLR